MESEFVDITEAAIEEALAEAGVEDLTVAEAANEVFDDGFPMEWGISDIEEALAADGRVEEADVSTAGRKKMADEKVAMPDGSYPIPNTGYLSKAVQALGRAGKDKMAKVKAHIVRRAKALKATAQLPDSWAVQQGGSGAGERAAAAVLAVLEADDAGSGKAYCVKDKKMVVPTKDGKCPSCGMKLPKPKG